LFNEQESDDDTDMFGEPKTKAKRPAAKSVTIAEEVSSHNFRIKRNTNNNFTNNYVVNNSPRRKLRKRQLKRRTFSAASPQKPQRRRTSLVSSSFSRFFVFFHSPLDKRSGTDTHISTCFPAGGGLFGGSDDEEDTFASFAASAPKKADPSPKAADIPEKKKPVGGVALFGGGTFTLLSFSFSLLLGSYSIDC